MLALYFAVFAVVSCSIVDEKDERLVDFSNSFEELQFPLFEQMPYLPFRHMMVPDWSNILPWYKGPHVCSSNRVLDKGHEQEHWTSNGFQGSPDKMEISSETCNGDNEKYICMKRAESQEGPKMIMTKYECCPGYMRNPYGETGCVKKDLHGAKMKPIEIEYIGGNVRNWKIQPKPGNKHNQEIAPSVETTAETAKPNGETEPDKEIAPPNLETAPNKEEIAPNVKTTPKKETATTAETAPNMETTPKEGTTHGEKTAK